MTTIEVTEEDRRLGGTNELDCPINRAARRAFPGKHVICGHLALMVDKRSVYSLPEVARDYIERYERGEDVGPISFAVIKTGGR